MPKAAYTGGKEGQRERHEQSGYGNWRQRVITNIDDLIAASKPKESGVPKPGAGGMPGGADMDVYEVGNSFYFPFYFS